MQKTEIAPTERDSFIAWLFERFNVPESRHLELKVDYVKELPPNCDFRRLKKMVETKWRTPYSRPFPYWFKSYIVVKQAQVPQAFLHPEIEKIRADKASFRKNFNACQEAKERVMDEVERLWGRRPGRRQECF